MRHDEMLGLLPRLWYGVEDNPGLRLFGLELLFWVLVIVLTVALVRYRPRLIEQAESRLREVSQNKRFWLAAFVLGVIVVRLALLQWIPVPVPIVHDEFSYLLGSDTFAHGRLTNPPSPMWVHFESFHMNVQPTYQSMYPPAQGLALAIGQKLTGVPWVGVVLSTALMCGAVYWMLLGWLPAPWAWLGGAFVCVRFGLFSYWMNSYWGGSVAALGGALVLGALPRLRNRPSIQTALVFASGLLILANSRPLEGFLFSLPLMIVAVMLLIKQIKSGSVTWGGMAKIVLPAMALLVLGAAWMLYYNWRGTGNPLLMPYQVNFQTYHISRPFPFQKPNPIPVYRHQAMKTFYIFYDYLILLRFKDNYESYTALKFSAYYAFFIWPLALLIAPGVYAMWRSEMRVALISVALVAADLLAQIWHPQPHYAAPATGALFLALLYSVRHFRNSPFKYAIWGSRALAIVFAVWMISPIAEALRDPYEIMPSASWTNDAGLVATPFPMQIKRASIQAKLNALSGKQLIIVHHPSKDMPGQDWIYNDAEIDDAHVIWARDMGYEKNKELLNYYSDRQAWYTDRGDQAVGIVPYDQAMYAMKLALDGAVSKSGSPQTARMGQHLSLTITKPLSAGLAEIAAPRSR